MMILLFFSLSPLVSIVRLFMLIFYSSSSDETIEVDQDQDQEQDPLLNLSEILLQYHHNHPRRDDDERGTATGTATGGSTSNNDEDEIDMKQIIQSLWKAYENTHTILPRYYLMNHKNTNPQPTYNGSYNIQSLYNNNNNNNNNNKNYEDSLLRHDLTLVIPWLLCLLLVIFPLVLSKMMKARRNYLNRNTTSSTTRTNHHRSTRRRRILKKKKERKIIHCLVNCLDKYSKVLSKKDFVGGEMTTTTTTTTFPSSDEDILDDEIESKIYLPKAGYCNNTTSSSSSRRDEVEVEVEVDSSPFKNDQIIEKEIQIIMKKERTRVVPGQCAICLNEYKEEESITWSSNLTCHHAFHKDCITKWIEKKISSSCPCCRQCFVDENVYLQMRKNMKKKEDSCKGLGLGLGFVASKTQ